VTASSTRLHRINIKGICYSNTEAADYKVTEFLTSTPKLPALIPLNARRRLQSVQDLSRFIKVAQCLCRNAESQQVQQSTKNGRSAIKGPSIVRGIVVPEHCHLRHQRGILTVSGFAHNRPSAEIPSGTAITLKIHQLCVSSSLPDYCFEEDCHFVIQSTTRDGHIQITRR
jgi:hypothetical protein